jgi:hypothetical protein
MQNHNNLNFIEIFLEKYAYIADNGYSWKLLDQAIFDLVNKYPQHSDLEAVYAKICLINRVYRANMQMAFSGAEIKLAEHFQNRHQTIDGILQSLESLTFSRESIVQIVMAHKRIEQISFEVLNKKSTSFTAKYLNFHLPDVVPIYDNWSKTNLEKLIGRKISEGAFSEYCEGILIIYEELVNKGIRKPSLKIIDCILYGGLG